MGKAKHPHNAERPLPARIRKALEADDIKTVIKHLTIRQRRFAEEYIVDYNGTAACIRAGYATEWADRQAHILMRHEGILAYITHLTASKESKIMAVDPDWVLQKITAIVNKDGARDGDVLRGLELIAKHLGMFIDRTELTGKDGGPLEVEQRKIAEEAESFTQTLKRMKRPNLKVVGDD
jgi:hypothetical protein